MNPMRFDEPDSWHHVMNRALGRKSMFDSENDFQRFIACIADVVQRGLIEIHAYCFMSTHFHLLVRSPVGMLAAAMRAIQSPYVMDYNQERDRDGPLVRGRYRSRLVDSIVYRRVVVRYIDHNPVAAGMSRVVGEYPHCSAADYVRRTGPTWLSRGWIEAEVREDSRTAEYDPSHYLAAFGAASMSELVEFVDQRLACRGTRHDPLDRMLELGPPFVAKWLAERAQLADAIEPYAPVASNSSVDAEISNLRAREGEWTIHSKGGTYDAWTVLRVGLSHELARTRKREIARSLGLAETKVHRLLGLHRVWACANPHYSTRAAAVASRAVERSVVGRRLIIPELTMA